MNKSVEIIQATSYAANIIQTYQNELRKLKDAMEQNEGKSTIMSTSMLSPGLIEHVGLVAPCLTITNHIL